MGQGTKFHLPSNGKTQEYLMNDNEYTEIKNHTLYGKNESYMGGMGLTDSGEAKPYKENGKIQWTTETKRIHFGNYGVLYKITLLGYTQSKIRLKASPNMYGQTVFLINGVWKKMNDIDGTDTIKYWILELDKPYFEFILAGGTPAPIEFEVL